MNRSPERKIVIGIPGGLMSFEHRRIWQKFFCALGFKTIFSGSTTNSIMQAGISLCSNETCLPVKVFTGHAASLCGRADCIFIPRYSSVCAGEKSCPKFCGLPDEVRLSLKNKIPVLDIAIDFCSGTSKTKSDLKRLADILGRNKKEVEAAFSDIVIPGLVQEKSPNISKAQDANGKPIIAVLGHPYMVFDKLISMDLIKKLETAGYRVLTPYDIRRSERRSHAAPFIGRGFFETGLDILGAFSIYLKTPGVAGIIYLTPFACGVDSLVTEFIERRLKKGSNPPFLKLTIDEHSGEAGLDTRLEAFLDMLPNSILFKKRQSI